MSFVQELRERRVPQIVSAYAVGSWGLVQFVQFLEGRLDWSPHVLNLVGLALLLLLLPTVAIVAWSQGRPGRDRWSRFVKAAVPLNVIVVAVVLFVLFQGKELRAVTTTVAVTDEHGAVVERTVPREAFLKRVMIFTPQFEDAGDEAWTAYGFALLLDLDLSQDPFVETTREEEFRADLNKTDLDLGDRVPRALQRKIAAERHIPAIFNGELERDGDELVLLMDLTATRTGRVTASRELRAPDLTTLVDLASRALREDLGVPASSLEGQVDLPAAELTTEDPRALRLYVEAVNLITEQADWAGSTSKLEEAVAADPTFALAHHMLSAVYVTQGFQDRALAAEQNAMAHIYRLPERVQYMIKAQYFVNYESDMDKSLAVVDMWTSLYPTDADAFRTKAQFCSITGDDAGAIACYERVLEIDPTQYETLRILGDLHKQREEFDAAASYLTRYAEAFPTNARAWRALASLHRATGDLDEAEAVLERAQTVDPNDSATSIMLAELHADRGRFAEAEALLDKVAARAEQPTEQVRAAEARRTILERQGRIRESMAEVERWSEAAVLTLNPLFFAVQRLNLLEPLAQTDRAEWALAQVDSVRAEVAPMVRAFAGMAAIPHLLALGRLDDAGAAIDAGEAAAREMSLEMLNPRINDLRGQLARLRGDAADAVRFHRQAVEKAPTEIPLRLELARSLGAAGEPDEAREILSRVLKRAPDRGDLNLELARLSRDDPARAREFLGVALRTWAKADPDYRPAAAARALAAELDALP